MELLQAQNLCIELMDKHGLTKEKGWKFEWINSKNSAGKCRTFGSKIIVGFTWGGRRQTVPTGTTTGGVIMLSSFITLHHSDEQVTDTILHEIAHGLTPGHGHDYVWQSKAISIGCNGKRCFDVNDSEELVEAKLEMSNVIGTCPKCGNKFFKTRMPKRDSWCRCTNRTFRQNEKISWVLNNEKNNTVSKPITKQMTPKVPVAASRGFQQFNAHTSFPDTLLSQAPDSYKKMLDKFEKDFLFETSGHIDREIFESIVREAKSRSSSWRTMNREVRKACDQYCYDNNIMSHKKFQNTFFYEGIMISRTTWGKNAPWIGDESL